MQDKTSTNRTRLRETQRKRSMQYRKRERRDRIKTRANNATLSPSHSVPPAKRRGRVGIPHRQCRTACAFICHLGGGPTQQPLCLRIPRRSFRSRVCNCKATEGIVPRDMTPLGAPSATVTPLTGFTEGGYRQG
ncbi:hypothetical protein CC79DRAFT_808559 [Sarocladium strictum]